MPGANGEGGTYDAVSAAETHVCAIKTDGSLKCWGRNNSGQVSGPNDEGGTFTAVSTGTYHTCAIKTEGSLECWGWDEDYGQVSGPNGEGGTFIAVSAGIEHTCAIKTDGSLECWGIDNFGQVSGPNAEGGTFTAVSVGVWETTCAIKTNGSLECWGRSSEGQRGLHLPLRPAPPSPVGNGAFSHTFTSGSGTPSGAFSVTVGALPPGLSLSSAGLLSGTPVGSGSFSFEVTARNLLGAATATFMIVVAQDSTAPIVTANVTGTLGLNGWYTSDVGVSWTVSDPESAIDSSTGCGSTTLSSDTAGTTLTCTATSAGGTSSSSVTIKRDATPPGVTCAAAPVYVLGGSHAGDVTADVTDATSLAAASSVSADVSAGEVATVGVKSKTLTGSDNAGNTTAATCPYIVRYSFGGFLSPQAGRNYTRGSTILSGSSCTTPRARPSRVERRRPSPAAHAGCSCASTVSCSRAVPCTTWPEEGSTSS